MEFLIKNERNGPLAALNTKTPGAFRSVCNMGASPPNPQSATPPPQTDLRPLIVRYQVTFI